MSSITRVFGLSGSGLDVDSIVSDLMKVERAKQDKLKQNKTIAEWQRSDYRDMNNALRALRDNVSSLRLQGTYLVKKATSTNEGIVKVSATNSAVAGTYTMKVTALATNARLNSSDEVSFDASKTNLYDQLGLTSTDPIKFTVNGSDEISIDPSTDTIDTLVSKINAAGAGVTAFFDKTLNRMFISSTATGAGATIDFDNVSNATELFTKLKLGGADPFAAVNGTDASFELNGVSLTQASNQFTIGGVKYTLTGISSTETVNITVSRDTDAIYNAIKSFVDLYNTTIDKINQKISETRYKDYLPLTDDEREQLTEAQQEAWEEKAKSGLLRNDSLLRGILSDMRSTLSSVVSNLDAKYDSLADIGITTGEYYEKGKLYIDETKLKEAISADPQAVMDLFTKSSDVTNEKGLAVRLYNDLNNGIKQITNKAGSESSYSLVDNSTLGKKISDYSKKISEWDERLEEIEERYYEKYAALETALSKMYSQSSWLSQMLGGTS